jgi:hypothetical protein
MMPYSQNAMLRRPRQPRKTENTTRFHWVALSNLLWLAVAFNNSLFRRRYKLARKDLKITDFDKEIPEKLVETLNKIDAETEELEQKAIWCKDHSFPEELRWLRCKINERSSIYVEICNAFGKFF